MLTLPSGGKVNARGCASMSAWCGPGARRSQARKVLPGMFLGQVLSAGGIWKGDIMVADIEELEQMDASKLHARRLNAKEVLTPMKGETYIFPIADGTVKISGGGDQDLRTPP